MEKKALYLHREKRTGEGQGRRPALAVGLLCHLDCDRCPADFEGYFDLHFDLICHRTVRFSFLLLLQAFGLPLCPPEHDTKIRKFLIPQHKTKKKIIIFFKIIH